jgi:hypothetical protein
MGLTQGIKKGGGRRGGRRPPARNDDCVGVKQQLQATICVNLDTAGAPERSGFGSGGQAPIPACPHFRARQPENLEGAPEFKNEEPIVENDYDERFGGVWHDPYDNGHFGHSQ